MNAESLLQHYARIADAPDATSRLRRFILDLAVRGKLVPQDPNDEPASELLNRIAKEKARLRLSIVNPPTRATALPNGWAATTIGSYASDVFTGPFGSMLHESDYVHGGVPLINPSHMKGDRIAHDPKVSVDARTASRMSSYALAVGDIVMARRGEVGRAALVEPAQSGWLCGTGSFYLRFLNEVNRRFLLLVLRTSNLRAYLAAKAVGTTMVNLNHGILKSAPLLVPPLAEQHRIVTKVDELMALCDRLEAARGSREAVRDRLAAASLARLNAPDPETFQADARFALNALPALTTRPDQIKQLRQTILNLAVRGKLVPQDAKDEPTSKLLARLAKEKAELLKAGEIRNEKTLSPILDVDRSFAIPANWTWVRLGALSQIVTSGSRDWAQHYSNEGAIFVRMGNLSKDHYRLRLDHIQRVNPPNDGEGTRTRLSAGDILISITGEVGMLGLIPEGFGEAYINQHTAMVRPMGAMKSRYLAELFRSPFAQDQFNAPQRGIKNSFRLSDVTQFIVPLPPLAEQHRIVAKVDALMALCDRLEASLTAATGIRSRLLDSLLADALAPELERSPSSNEIEADTQSAPASPIGPDFKELTAAVLAFAYERHRLASRDKTFGHIKAQKILHMVEAEAGLNLGRVPFKDAAGPNDFPHMLDAEEWARGSQYFSVEKIDKGYRLQPLPKFEQLMRAARKIEAGSLSRMEKIIDLFIPMNMEQAEVFTTVYAAWNNLLIEGKYPTDDEIIRAAREDWHPKKINIPRDQFLQQLRALKGTDFRPKGHGQLVRDVEQTRLF